MVIKAVFFDFDGTISDAKKIARDSMIQTLDEFGYDYDRKKLVRSEEHTSELQSH